MSHINYSESFKDFLRKSDSKVAQVLHNMRFKSYDPLMITNKEVDYITFRRDGTISYLPAGRECLFTEDGEWAREGRQNGKPSKVIKKLFHPRVHKYIKDTDFETFTNLYKAAFSDDGYKFTVRPGRDIGEVYCMDRGEGDASLNGSCMNDDDGYFDIYIDCKSLRIVTLEKDDLLYGRALLWTLKDGDKDIVFMDRIYVAKDYMYDMFVEYCKTNGWWRKKHYKTYDYKNEFVNSDGEEVRRKFVIYTDTEHDSYPYIDTFQWGGDGYLTNECQGEYSYSNTDGTREGDHDGQTWDEIDDCYIDEDDAVYIDEGDRGYRGRTTHIDNCVEIDNEWWHKEDSGIVQVNGSWYTKEDDDIVYVESEDEWYLMDDVVHCDFSETYELEDNCVYSDKHSTYILKEDAVEVDGNYYHKDDVTECV